VLGWSEAPPQQLVWYKSGHGTGHYLCLYYILQALTSCEKKSKKNPTSLDRRVINHYIKISLTKIIKMFLVKTGEGAYCEDSLPKWLSSHLEVSSFLVSSSSSKSSGFWVRASFLSGVGSPKPPQERQTATLWIKDIFNYILTRLACLIFVLSGFSVLKAVPVI